MKENQKKITADYIEMLYQSIDLYSYANMEDKS